MTTQTHLRRHHIPDVLDSFEQVEGLPLVFDSPHSGTTFPDSFTCAATPWQLKSNVDAFVDELFGHVTGQGAGFLAALFPRTFIDPNRSEHEIDTSLLAGPWPNPVRETRKTRAGMGVVRRDIVAGVPMYEEPLPVEDVLWRLQTFHAPYHETLAGMLERAYARHGAVWHVNCHSMKSTGTAMNVDEGSRRPDFVVSDFDGATAEPAFTAFVADCLRNKGYTVVINTPFRGAEIIHRYGDRDRDRHSVQIEVNRALYLDEANYEKSAGFESLWRDLKDMTDALAGFVSARAAVSTR